MDINHILFLIALLNLAGDLYNILQFRHHLPRWLISANIGAIALVVIGRVFFTPYCGAISITALTVYILAIRAYSRKRVVVPRLPSPATKLLIALNVISYANQIHHEAVDNPIAFITVGALYSPLLEQGQWWRLISAQFVHWGIMHLFFNMLGLWFLGPAVENTLGAIRFTLAYLVCGAAGMLIAWGVTSIGADSTHTTLLLGASASVLGLVGIQAALSLRAFRRGGGVRAKAQLASMTQIIVLQAIFDYMVPQVSSTAHIGGAACGFILGMFLLKPTRVWVA